MNFFYMNLLLDTEKVASLKIYRNNSIYWDIVCIGTPSILKKIIILTIILIGTY